MKKSRHILEYAGLRVLLSAVDVMPLGASLRIAQRFADAFYFLAAGRRRIAQENILHSGVATSSAAATARASFRHFARLAVETLASHRFFREHDWREHVDLDIPGETMSLLKNPRQGIILATGHLGNWEVAAQLLGHVKPLVAIARPMNNPFVQRLMDRRTGGGRFSTIPKRSRGPARFLQILRRGEILAILIDQHARRGGVPVQFFGRPAMTYPSAARLHLATRAPLCFGYCVRTAPMTYRISVRLVTGFVPSGDRDTDVKTLLQMLTNQLEAAVRSQPDQYLWAHRRWRGVD